MSNKNTNKTSVREDRLKNIHINNGKKGGCGCGKGKGK